MEIIFLIIGLTLGALIGWLVGKKTSSQSHSNADEINILREEKGMLNGRLEKATEVFKELQVKLETLSTQKDELLSENAKLNSDYENISLKLNDQKAELETLQEKFNKDFQLIANSILKNNSAEFAESNQKRLDEILTPLKEKIQSFEDKVESKYEKEFKERTSLIEQIKSLKDLNIQMSEEAQNLTKALKGDNKTQGNWGEFILEKVLENSGLINGEEYQTQHSTTNDDGARIQPDIIINLPDNKHIVVDSKVSLVAYQNYMNCEDKAEQEIHLKNHVLSVKNHIKGLSEKEYASAYGINSPDFVLLFIPIESSFGIAMRADNDLYQYAWDRKIVIVTPSTLLATLKTIKSVWNNEKQTKNALEIARQAGALHDKFVGFVEDLQKIEKGIESTKKAYDGAMNKLKDGSGNLVNATLKLEKLGAKTKKSMPSDVINDNNIELE